MFRKIGAVILLVSDMKRSTKFYRDVLGMDLKQQTKDWTEFSKFGAVLALHPTRKKKLKRNNSMLVGFNIGDIEIVCRDLKSKKVKFYKKLKEEPFGKHAIIEDPDGHLLSLVEMAPTKEEMRQISYYHGFAPV